MGHGGYGDSDTGGDGSPSGASPASRRPASGLSRLGRLLNPMLLSPRGLLGLAAALAVGYALSHLAGWRECTSIISGTPPPGYDLSSATALRAGLYAIFYFGFVLVAPILVLGAAVMALVERAAQPRRS